MCDFGESPDTKLAAAVSRLDLRPLDPCGTSAVLPAVVCSSMGLPCPLVWDSSPELLPAEELPDDRSPGRLAVVCAEWVRVTRHRPLAPPLSPEHRGHCFDFGHCFSLLWAPLSLGSMHLSTSADDERADAAQV